ncbi:hypothetical protein QTP88_013016 [Uroleucon formosanum]
MAVTGQQLEDAINPTLTVIDNWMRSRGLELSHQKSEARILSRRRAFIPPCLIPLRNEIRYLGVILDKRLTFAAHAITVATKAALSAAALSRLMPNIGGPAQRKRRLLASVVESQLLYAAPVWIPAIAEIAKTRAILIRPQSSAILRVIRSYPKEVRIFFMGLVFIFYSFHNAKFLEAEQSSLISFNVNYVVFKSALKHSSPFSLSFIKQSIYLYVKKINSKNLSFNC